MSIHRFMRMPQIRPERNIRSSLKKKTKKTIAVSCFPRQITRTRHNIHFFSLFSSKTWPSHCLDLRIYQQSILSALFMLSLRTSRNYTFRAEVTTERCNWFRLGRVGGQVGHWIDKILFVSLYFVFSIYLLGYLFLLHIFRHGYFISLVLAMYRFVWIYYAIIWRRLLANRHLFGP